MVTIQEYAEKHNISYEAVRKQVKRYAQELEEHISKQNRKQYLDEYAEKFLDDKREKSPIIIMEQAKDEELEEAKREIENLKLTLMELQSQLASSQNRVIALQEEKLTLIEERGKNQLLLELKERTDKELEEAKEKLSEAEKEVKSYQRTIFGLYKKL